MGKRPVDMPIEQNHTLAPEISEFCMTLIRIRGRWEINYLTIMCPDISYTVSVVSQFMHVP